MKIGTKSVLYGAHCFLLHPWFVAAAWWKLFGFPWDPRLWVAFFVHDFGYIGKPNMDGHEGETHVEFGAFVMGIFGKEWADFSRFHSRFYAKKAGVKPSKLCIADKLSLCLTPRWLYLPMVNWTGEIEEYLAKAKKSEGLDPDPGKYSSMGMDLSGQREWFDSMVAYLLKWVDEHKDGREDTWTPLSQIEDAKKRVAMWEKNEPR